MSSRSAAWALMCLTFVCSAPAWALDGRKPGSVLIYPTHHAAARGFTVLSVTNSAGDNMNFQTLGGATSAHWQFLNVAPGVSPLLPSSCSVTNRAELLTPSDTKSILVNCWNGGNNKGYTVVSAQDPTFYNTDWSHNYLLGSELVINLAGGVFCLNAIPFTSPQTRGSHTDNDDAGAGLGDGTGDGDGQIDFDGIEYEGIADHLYGEFVAVSGSTLTLLNLSGGSSFSASIIFDIWNDDEQPLSQQLVFRCWFEEELETLNQAFTTSYLRDNTLNDSTTLDLDCDNDNDIEAGWFRIRGLNYSSSVDSCLNPALLGAITAGPAAPLNGGSIEINGGHLLWESEEKQFNGDFFKLGTNDPECPELVPVDPICDAGVDQMVDDGVEVILDGSASTDPDGMIVQYFWDLGDGAMANTAVVMHTYAGPGTYTAMLTVTDDDGLDADCAVVITVNGLPNCDAGAAQMANLGNPVTFDGSNSMDADGSIASYDWNYGDGMEDLDAGAMPSHTYTSSGDYVVTLTVTDNDGASVMCVTAAQINRPPTCNAGSIQAGNVGDNFTFDGSGSIDRDGSIDTFDWSWGDGMPDDLDAGAMPSHIYASAGTFTVTLTITDDDGAESTCTTLAEVNAFPVCDAGIDQVGNENDTFNFDGSNSSDSDGTVDTYDWNYGDGDEDLDAGPQTSHTYTGFGTFTVTLTITDNNGAVSECTLKVVINALPLCDAGTTVTGDEGESVDFDGSASSDPDGTIAKYDWNYGDGTAPALDVGPTPSHIYANPGTYTATLTVTDNDGATASCMVTVEINAKPICDAGTDQFGNVGDTFDFDGSSSMDPDGSIVQYDWLFGDGTAQVIDVGPTPDHVYNTPGEFTVLLRVTDNKGSFVNCTVKAFVNDIPVCNAGPTATGNVDGSFDFDGSNSVDSDGSVATYDWDYGDGTQVDVDAGPTPSHVYTTAGTYTVTLTVTDNDGASSVCETTAEVNAFPECDAGPTQSGIVDGTFNFDGSNSLDTDGSIASYDWSWGDGTPDSLNAGATPSHVYAMAGTFTVTLTVTDDKGAASMCTTTAFVNAPPICLAGSIQTGNEGDTFSFDASGSSDSDGMVASYDWDFGDGSLVLLNGGATPMHDYATPGTYTVQLTITDDKGATSVCFTEAQVNGFPLCDAGPDQFVNAGDIVQFDGSASSDSDGTVVQYDWTYGDGSLPDIDAGPNPMHAFVHAGDYTVRLSITDDKGAVTKCKTHIFVNGIPSCDAGPAQAGSVGDRLSFDGSSSHDADGSIVRYDWNFGDGTMVAMDAGSSPSHPFATPGTYTVTLTVTDDDGATKECTTTATVNALPECDAGPTAIGSAGGVFSFDGSMSSDLEGAIAQFDWDFGDGTAVAVDVGPTPTHVYAVAGTFTVTLTVTDSFGATSMCTTLAEVNALPICNAGPTAFGETGDTFSFDGSMSQDDDGTVVQYDWNFGDGSPVALDAGPTPSHTYRTFGTYTVTLTITDDFGATSTCGTLADVNSPPTCDAGSDKMVDVGVFVIFDSLDSDDRDGSIVAGEWDFGDGSAIAMGSVVSHAYAASGTYTVTLEITDNDGAMATCSIEVKVNDPPLCVAGPSQTGNDGESISFDGSSSSDPDGSIVSYDWDFGDGTSPALDAGPTPSHIFAGTGTFTVTLTCTDDLGSKVSCTTTAVINAFPVCDAGPTITDTVDELVSFDANASMDSDGTVNRYDWDFGDGSPDAIDAGPMPSHTYTSFGLFTVTLTITDDDGAVVMCTTLADINAPPLCNAGLPDPPAINLGDTVDFDGSASTDLDGTIVSYEWNFGDGSPAAFGAMVSHVYTAPGDYVVLLTVTDDDGKTSSCGLLQGTVIFVNAPPVCDAGGPYDGDIFDDIEFDGSASMDPDGSIVSYDWDYGDGSLVAFDAGPTPIHFYSQAGVFTCSLTVTDDFGKAVVCTALVNIVDVSGALVFSGDDSGEHCQINLQCGSMPTILLQWVLDNSNTRGKGTNGILAIGLQETALPILFSLANESFLNWVEGLDDPLVPVRRVIDPLELTDPSHPDYLEDFDDYEMIFIPSFERHTAGGISQELLDALAFRKDDIKEYTLKRGGGLLAMTQADDDDFVPAISGAYDWSPIPFSTHSFRYFFVTPLFYPLGLANGVPAPLSDLGSSPLGNIILSHESYHNTFLPDPVFGFSGLESFVDGNEVSVLGEVAILGGVPNPPSFPRLSDGSRPRMDKADVSTTRSTQATGQSSEAGAPARGSR